MKKLAVVMGSAVLAGVVGVSLVFAADAPSGAPAPAGAAATYGKSCSSCHGKDGKGNAKMAKMLKVDAAALDLTSAAAQGRTDAELATVIADGKGKMPKYGAKLSPAETTDMVAYLRGLSAGAPASASSTTMVGSVAAVPAAPPAYAKNCASCHGKDAKGNEKMTKALKCDLAALDLLDEGTLGQTDEALVKVTTDGKAKMPAYGKKLAAGDISTIIAWLRVLKPAK